MKRWAGDLLEKEKNGKFCFDFKINNFEFWFREKNGSLKVSFQQVQKIQQKQFGDISQ